MNRADDTTRVARHYDATAEQYDRYIRWFEALLVGDGRRWACAQARGAVLEIAVGTGRNFPYYPADTHVTGVDLSAAMLAVARRRARSLGRAVDVQVGDAQRLAFPDNDFDTVVCTLALCTIPDVRQAVAEIKRVLRPGGQFVSLEHVRSPLPPVRLAQRLLNPLAERFCADHLLRDPLANVTAAGFDVPHCTRSKLGIMERLVARKPV